MDVFLEINNKYIRRIKNGIKISFKSISLKRYSPNNEEIEDNKNIILTV